MKNTMMELEMITVAEMRAWDAYTIAHFVPGRELMRRAAEGVFRSMDWEGRKTAIISGSGNNGGDGYALACMLADAGHDVAVFRTSEKCSEDGRFYLAQAREKGVKDAAFSEETDLSGFDIYVDCILGTGFSGSPRGTARQAIEALNRQKGYVISVDINSGMNGDTGEAELAVRSDLTVSIGFYKTGLFRGRSEELIGKRINVDIGIRKPNLQEDLLIINTTREERQRIVNESLGLIDGACDGCSPGIISMYDDYIDGKKELYEVNAAFHRSYVQEDADRAEGGFSCMMPGD